MFISFEGIEGSGKSTQARRLADRLREMAMPVLSTMEPGGTRVGQYIRRILLDSQNDELSPLGELLLYAADRAQHVKEVIKPALEQGVWIVCDRYVDATLAYQGYARGQEMGFIRKLNEKATLGICPDLTFLIDCPVNVGIARAFERNQTLLEQGQDRFEKEHATFHEAVRHGYLTLAREEPDRFVVVDGMGEEEGVAGIIFDHIRPFLLSGHPEEL